VLSREAIVRATLMDASYKPGDICILRNKKPGEHWERSWTTRFPVTLVSHFCGFPDYWWVDDADGRRVWLNENDLVVLRPKSGVR
jgi:hypothetical protein